VTVHTAKPADLLSALSLAVVTSRVFLPFAGWVPACSVKLPTLRAATCVAGRGLTDPPALGRRRGFRRDSTAVTGLSSDAEKW
jgi:hypothetical protein